MSALPELARLHAAALRAQGHSYSPYSKYPVGAALLLADGTIVAGCNVENSSFGATICGERNAVWAAIAQGGPLVEARAPRAMALITREEASPCGICLQVLAEFCTPDFPIYLGTPAGPGRPVPLKDFLSRPFLPAALA